MEIVTGAMNTLLPKLAALMTDEYKLQKSLRGEIMVLKAELESMQAALERLSEVPAIDNQIKIWARDVRELSYDIEDSIDKFMVRIHTNPSAKPHGIMGFIEKCMRLLTTAKTRHQIATDIKGMKTLVKEVAERRDRYKVDNVVVQPTTTIIDPRLHGMYEESSKLVAIGGPSEELTELLMEREGTSKRPLKVISIVGVGGLGKTTLANVLYQQLRGQFECHAFVSVSLKPDLKSILSSMLRQVSEQSHGNTETWDVVELVNKIRRVLEDKRYFIIIDDIWDQTAWKHIKCALIENNCGSRIIATTRVADVAASCCSGTDGAIYKLKSLSHDDSKKLFYKRIFGCEDGCHPELKQISEQILRKCDGVPLAIITLASLLANKPRNINQWNSVHNSIGSGLEKCTSMETMRQILSISYYDLPSHLKQCLLYLSVFPEDYSISTDQLVRRWISEGFVHGKHVDTLYQLGNSYLYELINRSMIQPEHMHTNGGVEACRVHDMILDLITSLSSSEGVVTILDGHHPTNLPEKIRRLSLQNSEEERPIPHETMSMSNVRSLIIFPSATDLMPPLSSFQVLRVLDLEHCRDLENHHINGVGNLLHLRYLGLRDTNVTNLPKEIGNLHCLNTLDLSQTGINDLPSTIVQLKQLVRLYIETPVKLPDGIGNLGSLQVLSSFGVSSSPNILKELGNLTELRVLHISLNSGIGTWNKSYEKPLLDSLCNLQKITELHIQSSGVPTEFIADSEWFPQRIQSFLGGGISSLPRWMNSSLSDLFDINMTLNILRQEDLQNLGALPFLHYLYLSVSKIESTEERFVIGNTDHANFRCLYLFSIESDAMGLTFAQRAMPRLAILQVIFRVRDTKDANGDSVLGLENLSSLKQVIVKIDCRGSRVCEVDDAEAAMLKATNMNPNHPSLHVIRHYEDEIIGDKEKLQVVEETTIGEEEDEIVLQRVGPWGGDGWKDHDITVAPRRLESVKVSSGVVVDALGFSYRDRYGKQHRTTLWGGVGGSARTIELGPSEFVTEVSGTHGRFFQFQNVVTSLMLVTNIRSYGPFGQPQGTPFRARAQQNGSIVGFFARSSFYLEAIGVYIHP